MKIIVLALGSDGDINPMIAVAKKMQAKGHEVEFLASGYFEEKAKAANLIFISIGERALYEKALKQKGIWHPYFAFDAMWKILFESIPLTYEILKSRYTPGTLIVGTSLAFAARMFQEQTDAKLATVHLSPSIAISSYTPPVGPNGPLPEQTPLLLKQLYVAMLDTFLLDRACRSDLNRFRKTIGLPPIKNVFTKWLNSPDLVVMAWPEWFAPPQPDWPVNSVCTDFPFFEHENTAGISANTMEFIRSGSPPVVFTAGTAMAQGADHFRCALKTLAGQSMRGIFVCKFRDIVPNSLPSNIHYTPYEPFDKLFPHALAVQHHGGIGTSAQTLRAGKPHLVIPFAHDQFDNAVRLEQLGVSKTGKKNAPMEWHKLLTALTSNSKFLEECKNIQSRIEVQPDHLDTIAEAILAKFQICSPN